MQNERIIAASAIAAALAIGAWLFQPDKAFAIVPAAIGMPLSATSLPLDRDNAALDRIGALKFLGAVQIRSSNPLFGGLSALRSGTGAQMLAATDTGYWFAFDTVEQAGRLVGVSHGVLSPIIQADGKPAARKDIGDAEALDWDPGTGTATIVYEQDHRLAHFKGIDPSVPATLGAAPAETERLTAMTGWPLNGGGEAMAVLPTLDGRQTRIVISETARRLDGAPAALLTRDGTTTEIGVAGVDGFSPTDAIALDDHRILVLHRRFTPLMGVGAALTLVDLAPALAQAQPALTLPGKLLAQWAPPLTLDNMEGLAIRRSGDRVFVYVVSDDNLNSLQRTLLMKFELIAPPASAPSP